MRLHDWHGQAASAAYPLAAGLQIDPRKRGCADRQQGARARAIQRCQIGRVESPGKMKAPAFSRGFQREANEFDLGMDVA